MIPYNIIAQKADGGQLAPEDLTAFIKAYTAGEVPDYQMAALLMAIYIRGMEDEELFALTKVMLESGRRFDFSAAEGYVADKHSTGGVGDKISLILAPLMGALGLHIPMISGRGLGHTGGTLDKLESIPGFDVNLPPARFEELVLEDKVALIGQTEDICPADRKLYALRDVTATVRSIPLISASIMSKKLAEGLNGLILDVKTGNGAFMTDREHARKLAQTLIRIGKYYGVDTRALLTDMNQPLGHAVGNWLEVRESLEVLQGKGPEDVKELTLALGTELCRMAEPSLTEAEARERQVKALEDGSALEMFLRICRNQGGDISVLEYPEKYPPAPVVEEFVAPEGGYLAEIDTMRLGFLAIELKAGRKQKSDTVDPRTGFLIFRKIGDEVEKGTPLVKILAPSRAAAELVKQALPEVFRITPSQPEPPPLIYERLT